MRIAYQEWGNSNVTKKVLAVHGWLDNSNSFSLLGPKIAALGYHCIAIDQIGHGKSSHVGPEAAYSTPGGVAYINEVVDTLGWKAPNVLGKAPYSCFPGINLCTEHTVICMNRS